MTDPFDSEEFDGICYAYRCAQGHLPTEVAFRFEAIKTYCRRILAEAQRGAEPIAAYDEEGDVTWTRAKPPFHVGGLLYAAPQRTAQPKHLVRRGLRPDGTYPPADDDESLFSEHEEDSIAAEKAAAATPRTKADR